MWHAQIREGTVAQAVSQIFQPWQESTEAMEVQVLRNRAGAPQAEDSPESALPVLTGAGGHLARAAAQPAGRLDGVHSFHPLPGDSRETPHTHQCPTAQTVPTAWPHPSPSWEGETVLQLGTKMKSWQQNSGVSPTDTRRLVHEAVGQSLGMQNNTHHGGHPSKRTKTQKGHRTLPATQQLTPDFQERL